MSSGFGENLRFCFGAQIAFVFSRLLYICFRASSHARQRAGFMVSGAASPPGRRKADTRARVG